MSKGEPVPIKFKPEVVKDATRRAAEYTYFDTDRVRFVNGYPQSIGGWVKANSAAVIGVPRALFAWTNLSGQNLMSIGTACKYYVERGGTFDDITPLRLTFTLATSTSIASTISTGTIVVTHTSHGASIGDYVTLSGATTFGGLTTGNLNKEFVITAVTANTWTAETGGTASSTTTGGGASVVAKYQVACGTDSAVSGAGWGAGVWGRGTWGSAADVTVSINQLRVWTQDAWGEDLVYNYRGGKPYYYDSSANTRGDALEDLPSASDVPESVDQLLVSTDERTVIAFGCTPLGSSVHDPLMIRWADNESLVDWTPTSVNSAGGIRLTVGSQHMIAVKIRQGILTFTNKAAYLLQYLGPGYGQKLVADNISILGPKAANVLNGVAYIFARRGLYMYNGTYQEIPCGISDYVYKNMNIDQAWKCYVSINPLFNEVWFHYPSTGSSSIDKYVILQVSTGTFVPGALPRSAMLENGVFNNPRGADEDGYIYDHEFGVDDGSTNPVSSLNSYVEGNLSAIDSGKKAVRIRSLWPDISFEGSTAVTPTVTLSLRLQDKMGSDASLVEIGDAVRTVSVPVEEFTDKIDVGKRARFIAFRIDCNTVGTAWRLGVPHADIISDGQR